MVWCWYHELVPIVVPIRAKNALFSGFSKSIENSDGSFEISVKNEMNHPRGFFALENFFEFFFLGNLDNFLAQKPEIFFFKIILFVKTSSRMVHVSFDADFKTTIRILI